LNNKKKFRIAVILGSVTNNSNTRKALHVAIDELNKHDEIIVDLIDPKELDLPFPGINSSSLDPKKIQQIVQDATGVILATPEYHGSYSSILKLIIENLGYPSKLSGKPISILGVASGDIGAIKSIESLRGVCAHVGGIILPGSASIPEVEQHFNEEGVCITPKIEKRIRSISNNLINFIEENIRPQIALEEIVREKKC
jgi:NAD(P)H-dependent FMN reductase